MVDVFENGLSGEKYRIIRAILELCDQDLRPGDIIGIVNERKNHVEIQQELQKALNAHMKMVR